MKRSIVLQKWNRERSRKIVQVKRKKVSRITFPQKENHDG
ncbi:hypothetical protein CTL2C_865 [Chlamydia trachomatis L2c]|nr:hypothetical protein CTL2C_865 [Chlamydia trachomatis L2c]AHC17756.1 hypothetical protein CTW3_02065 [Chlamydia trachomatis C/TW-3]AKR33068.1 hypothetical protein DCS63711_02050 [Chlamydia trachomatis D/CS637/11]